VLPGEPVEPELPVSVGISARLPTSKGGRLVDDRLTETRGKGFSGARVGVAPDGAYGQTVEQAFPTTENDVTSGSVDPRSM
jgi:hypothetical protein